ncbi:MAG: hypothetical protein JWN70_6843 [Planctomycetaceae bacterium]|nr:hypothetical protein [Planctomycetaceae bacterium]
MNQSPSARISELERRVGVLTNVAIIQTIALAYLLQVLAIAVMAFLVLLPILAFTHKRIPALAKRCGRLFSLASDTPAKATPSADVGLTD